MDQAEFHTACRQAFQFLETEYGCIASRPQDDFRLSAELRGFELECRNRTTSLVLRFEAVEQLPTVHLRRLEAPAEVHSLGLLLIARSPNLNPLANEPGLPLRQTPAELIQKYAAALRETARDILRGDFSIFPKLQELHDDYKMKLISGHRPYHF